MCAKTWRVFETLRNLMDDFIFVWSKCIFFSFVHWTYLRRRVVKSLWILLRLIELTDYADSTGLIHKSITIPPLFAAMDWINLYCDWKFILIILKKRQHANFLCSFGVKSSQIRLESNCIDFVFFFLNKHTKGVHFRHSPYIIHKNQIRIKTSKAHLPYENELSKKPKHFVSRPI